MHEKEKKHFFPFYITEMYKKKTNYIFFIVEMYDSNNFLLLTKS